MATQQSRKKHTGLLPTVRNKLRFFSHWPRSTILFWVAIAGAIASIFALIGTFFVPDGWQSCWVACSSTAYIIILMLIVIYVIWDRGNVIVAYTERLTESHAAEDAAAKDARYTSVLPLLHSIFHALRDVMVKLRTETITSGDIPDEAFSRKLLDLFREVFRVTTNADCATCIKAFDGTPESLRTICRDSVSEASRGRDDSASLARVSSNFDFRTIMAGDRRYFFSNDLLRDEAEGNYYNDTPRWQERYRSAIIWPIRYHDVTLGKYQIFGFLCVDTMATYVFDEKKHMEIGACVADMLYTYFSEADSVGRSVVV